MTTLQERLPDYFKNGKISIPEKIKEKLYNMQYRIIGHHSSIEICHWTKRSVLDAGTCYKEKFYGIDAHMCAQIAPTTLWCSNNCTFCWRPMEFMKAIDIKKDQVDDPDIIINGAIKSRKLLLIGFKGNKRACKEKIKQILNEPPNHWAISLSGEPTLYPLLPSLINKLKRKSYVRSVFLVTNGLEYEIIREMKRKRALPTQLYVSIAGSNKTIYRQIHRPARRDFWERFNTTLEMLKKLNTRTVIRLTVIKGLNDEEKFIKEFAELLENTKTDFVEVKAYMYLGYSMQRLKRENMPTHAYIKQFTKKLLEYMPSYHYEDEQPESRIVLLKRNTCKKQNIIYYHDNLPPQEITENWRLFMLKSKYRRTIPFLRSLGINTEKNNCITLKQVAGQIGISKRKFIQMINEFIEENYGKNKSN